MEAKKNKIVEMMNDLSAIMQQTASSTQEVSTSVDEFSKWLKNLMKQVQIWKIQQNPFRNQ